MTNNKEEIIATIGKLDSFLPLLRLLNLSGMLPPLSIYRVPWKNFLYNIFSLLTFLTFIPSILAQMIGFYLYGDSLILVTVIIFQLAAYFDGMVAMAYFIRHRKRLVETFYRMETIFIPYMAKVGNPQIQKDILAQNKKFSKLITTIAIGAFLADMCTWCVLPSVVRHLAYLGEEKELDEGEQHFEYFILVMWLPKNSTVFPTYQLVHSLQFFSVWGVVANYAAGKLIIVTLFYHLQSQFKILTSAIEDIDRICISEITPSNEDERIWRELGVDYESLEETQQLPSKASSFNLSNIQNGILNILQKEESAVETSGSHRQRSIDEFIYVSDCVKYHQALLT